MNRRVGSTVRTLLVIATVVGAVLVPGRAEATNCLNGNPVKKDVTLKANIIECGQHGIEVGRDNLTIDLNGHTIDGNDSSGRHGIFVDGFDGTRIVGPGTIRDFGTGILIRDADGSSISRVTVRDNVNQFTGGIVVTRRGLSKIDFTDGISVTNNHVTLNAGTGILIHRSVRGARVTGNNVEDNGGDGIFFGGAGERRDLNDGTLPNNSDSVREEVAVRGVVVKNNDVTSNDVTGIGVTGEPAKGITISGNEASDNGSPDTGGNAPTGHEHREQDDRGGHGIKVAGDLSNITITNNVANGNGPGGSCSERNGAGIFVAGDSGNVTIDNNTTDDNAMAGVFVAGEGERYKVRNNPSIAGNNLNCEDDEGGVKLAGAFAKIDISGNTLDANGSGITLTGHHSSATISDNTSSNNVGAGGGHLEDTAGILVKGRSLNLQIVGNTTNNNSNTSGVLAHGIEVLGSVRRVGDAARAVLIKGNLANGNEGRGIGVFAEASIPTPCGDDGPDVGTDPDCPPAEDAKVGDPNPEEADNDCNDDGDEVPSEPGDCPDDTVNDAKNVLVSGNTTNNNGTDGIFAITDLTLANNIANDNTDFGIEHNSDPTVAPRLADPADGPHLLEDGGGNTATGNATNCSVGLTC